MISTPTMKIPLQTDDHGTIHVSGTRVTLETIINYYLQGETPEALHDGFPTVPLTDIYAVIAYYLSNRADIDAYLAQRETITAQIRQENEANYTPEQRAFQEKLRHLAQEKRHTQDK